MTTTTTQPLSRASVENADKDTMEAGSNFRDILAVCDSLNKLHVTLGRLAYALQRKNIELGLTQKLQGNNAEKK